MAGLTIFIDHNLLASILSATLCSLINVGVPYTTSSYNNI